MFDDNTYENIDLSQTIKVAGMVNDSITDGPGLRFTLFLQGCKMKCLGCHNPDSIDIDGGELYIIKDILNKIQNNPILTGVTFSGGEPLLQAKALFSLATAIKSLGLDLAVYTGYKFEDLLNSTAGIYEYTDKHDVIQLLELADTMVDGPFIIEKKSLNLPFRGSTNQRILDVRESLKQTQAIKKKDPTWTLEI